MTNSIFMGDLKSKSYLGSSYFIDASFLYKPEHPTAYKYKINNIFYMI